MKDYYKILEVSYNASAEEIRQAYHRLAKKFHPDKNTGNYRTTDLFAEVREAYTILSDEKKRMVFHSQSHYPYLQPQPAPEKTEAILAKSKKLHNRVMEMNLFQINLAVITQSIDHLLSNRTLTVLQKETNNNLKAEVIATLLVTMKNLPDRNVLPLKEKLLIVAGDNALLQDSIHQFYLKKHRNRLWENYNLLIIIIATIIICIAIVYLAG